LVERISGRLFSQASAPNGAEAPSVPARTKLNILFGSQSGNAESLAKKLVKDAKNQGYEVATAPLEKVSPASLAGEKCALIITSTRGEGDPPDNAAPFWEALQAYNEANLTNLSFSVLALGDTNYEDFCGFGKKLDSRLEELGARRIFERIDCNVDFEEGASRWQKGVLEAVGKLGSANGASTGDQPEEECRCQPSKKNRLAIPEKILFRRACW